MLRIEIIKTIVMNTNHASLKNAKRIALVLPKILTDEAVGIALALFIFFKQKNESAAIFSENPIPSQWKCLDTSPLAFGQTESSAVTVIAIDREKTPVKEISYHNDPASQFVEIHIVPDKKIITADDIAIEQKILPPDSVITIAAKNISSIGSIWKAHPELFYERPVIALDRDFSSETMTEKTVKLMKEFSAEAWSLPVINALLFSLYAETDCLKKTGVAEPAIALGAELLNLGADHTAVATNFEHKPAMPMIQLLGRACARSKLDAKSQIFWSFMTAEDFLITNTSINALPFITAEIKKIFPMPKTAVFLWQNGTAKKICSEIFIDGKKQDKLQGVKSDYGSFLEAETELAKLLVKTA